MPNNSDKIYCIIVISQPMMIWPLATKYKAAFVIEVDNFNFSSSILKSLNLSFDKDHWYICLFPFHKALLQTVSTTIITWQWHEVRLVCQLAHEPFLQLMESTAASEPRHWRSKSCEWERIRDGSTHRVGNPFVVVFLWEVKKFSWNTIKWKANAKIGALKNERRPF